MKSAFECLLKEVSSKIGDEDVKRAQAYHCLSRRQCPETALDQPPNTLQEADSPNCQCHPAFRLYQFTNPILVDDCNSIIAGHGRVEAANTIGLAKLEVPTVRLSDMSEAEVRAYVIADNKLAENAGWDLMNPLIFRWCHKRQRTRGFRAALRRSVRPEAASEVLAWSV